MRNGDANWRGYGDGGSLVSPEGARRVKKGGSLKVDLIIGDAYREKEMSPIHLARHLFTYPGAKRRHGLSPDVSPINREVTPCPSRNATGGGCSLPAAHGGSHVNWATLDNWIDQHPEDCQACEVTR